MRYKECWLSKTLQSYTLSSSIFLFRLRSKRLKQAHSNRTGNRGSIPFTNLRSVRNTLFIGFLNILSTVGRRNLSIYQTWKKNKLNSTKTNLCAPYQGSFFRLQNTEGLTLVGVFMEGTTLTCLETYSDAKKRTLLHTRSIPQNQNTYVIAFHKVHSIIKNTKKQTSTQQMTHQEP
jgi:hypothetical protein